MPTRTIEQLKLEIDKMVEDRRATRLINPILTLLYLRHFNETDEPSLIFDKVKEGYEDTVCDLIKNYLHHNFNVGGTFNDSYLQRLASRHRVLDHIVGKTFKVTEDYASHHIELIDYIVGKVKQHLDAKLGNLIHLTHIVEKDERSAIVQILNDRSSRAFHDLLEKGFNENSEGFLTMSYGFEICMFAILKVFLAKFGCRIYRDSKTYASDKGTDLSTNFGVVYQIKNLCLCSEKKFRELLDELLFNFSDGRIQQGNVFLIVKSISREEFASELRDNSINCMTEKGITDLLDKLSADEKWEVLRQMVCEFKREIVSNVCAMCEKPEKSVCPYHFRAGGI